MINFTVNDNYQYVSRTANVHSAIDHILPHIYIHTYSKTYNKRRMMFTSTILWSFLLLGVSLRLDMSQAFPLVSKTTTCSSTSFTTKTTTTSLCASVDLKDLAGSTPPFSNGFDPLRLSAVGSEATLAWFQAAYVNTSSLHKYMYRCYSNAPYTCTKANLTTPPFSINE